MATVAVRAFGRRVKELRQVRSDLEHERTRRTDHDLTHTDRYHELAQLELQLVDELEEAVVAGAFSF